MSFPKEIQQLWSSDKVCPGRHNRGFHLVFLPPVSLLLLGSAVVECLTRDLEAAGSSLTGITALCVLEQDIDPSLVLVQPKKTRPFITERLLMGHKESNKKKNKSLLSPYKVDRKLKQISNNKLQ